jgi:predicted transcriptional regulator
VGRRAVQAEAAGFEQTSRGGATLAAVRMRMLPWQLSDAMNATSMKDRIVETIKSLPADATVEDAIERLLFLAQVERGLRQAEAGDTIPHSEMKQRFAR